MNTVSGDFINYVENELTSIIMRFVSTLEEKRANQIAREIVVLVDWNNSALMHKGLSWMAKNYLSKMKII